MASENEKFYSDKVIKHRDEKDFIEKIYMKIKKIKNKVYKSFLKIGNKIWTSLL